MCSWWWRPSGRVSLPRAGRQGTPPRAELRRRTVSARILSTSCWLFLPRVAYRWIARMCHELQHIRVCNQRKLQPGETASGLCALGCVCCELWGGARPAIARAAPLRRARARPPARPLPAAGSSPRVPQVLAHCSSGLTSGRGPSRRFSQITPPETARSPPNLETQPITKQTRLYTLQAGAGISRTLELLAVGTPTAKMLRARPGLRAGPPAPRAGRSSLSVRASAQPFVFSTPGERRVACARFAVAARTPADAVARPPSFSCPMAYRQARRR